MKPSQHEKGHVFKSQGDDPKALVWDGTDFVENTEYAVPATLTYSEYLENWYWYERASLKFEPLIELVL